MEPSLFSLSFRVKFHIKVSYLCFNILICKQVFVNDHENMNYKSNNQKIFIIPKIIIYDHFYNFC
jgi:hypothetical protein